MVSIHLLAETVYKAKIKSHASGRAGLHDLLMQEQVLLNRVLGRENGHEVSREDLVRFAHAAIDPATGKAYPEMEEAVLGGGKGLFGDAAGSEILEGAFTMHTLRSLGSTGKWKSPLSKTLRRSIRSTGTQSS